MGQKSFLIFNFHWWLGLEQDLLVAAGSLPGELAPNLAPATPAEDAAAAVAAADARPGAARQDSAAPDPASKSVCRNM